VEFGIVGQVSDKQVAYLGRITANVERLERMLNDLPERAKIESGTVEVHLGVVDLSAAIMAAVEVF
jgi:signal transduction histidine kinase